MSEVLAEHLGYLILKGRQELFSKAISRVLSPGATVADLGCGVGVLGHLCLKAGAGHVWGIDGSDAIEIARESARRAGLTQQYTCIRGSTFEVDLPEKVDVLICDHVGYFGVDYGIVGLLADARRRFLKQDGHILPRRIRLLIAGVASSDCREKADAWTAPEIPDELRWLHEAGLNTKYAVNLTDRQICTEPAILGEIDLTSDNPDSLSFDTCLKASREDRCDGLVGWFECELADGIWMTNSPLSLESIGRSQAYLPARQSFDVTTGDEIAVTIRMRFRPEFFAWSIKPPGQQQVQKLSTWASAILTDQDLQSQSDRAVLLNPVGHARKALLNLVDSKRSAREIEEILAELDPALFPTEARVRSFAVRELARHSKK